MSDRSFNNDRSIKATTCPCRGCGDRVVGCHAECGRYAEWKTFIAEIKEREEQEVKSVDLINRANLRKTWKRWRDAKS